MSFPAFVQPRVILLRDGADTSQGVGQLLSNISACHAVVDILKTTLGPRGMDKLIHEGGKDATISNDGATIIKLLDIVHPAAKTLVDIAKNQDDEAGDGTTSVVLLAGEFLKQARQFLEDGVHPQVIIRGFRTAAQLAHEKIDALSASLDSLSGLAKDRDDLLLRCARTAMNSKLISGQQDFFAPMVVRAVKMLDEHEMDLGMIGMKKVPGGAVGQSILVDGVAFKKTFSYAGFEQQRKQFANPKIALLNVELELKSERSDAEIRIKDPAEYQRIVEAEWAIIYGKLEKIRASGAKIVLSRLPIGDLATQYFADHDMFCAGRVDKADLVRVCSATGGMIQTSLEGLSGSVLGTCALFEENQVGSERFNFFTGCPKAKACTFILRGGAEQFIEETERSLHDAIMIVKRAAQSSSVLGGAGAVEMELSRYLREQSLLIKDKTQAIVGAYAKAFECIPKQLAENAGFDSTDVVSALRRAHAQGQVWAGVDIENEGVLNSFENFIWEPVVVKRHAVSAATEAACVILSVDETIRNPKSQGIPDAGGPVMPQQQGRGMRSIR